MWLAISFICTCKEELIVKIRELEKQLRNERCTLQADILKWERFNRYCDLLLTQAASDMALVSRRTNKYVDAKRLSFAVSKALEKSIEQLEYRLYQYIQLEVKLRNMKAETGMDVEDALHGPQIDRVLRKYGG